MAEKTALASTCKNIAREPWQHHRFARPASPEWNVTIWSPWCGNSAKCCATSWTEMGATPCLMPKFCWTHIERLCKNIMNSTSKKTLEASMRLRSPPCHLVQGAPWCAHALKELAQHPELHMHKTTLDIPMRPEHGGALRGTSTVWSRVNCCHAYAQAYGQKCLRYSAWSVWHRYGLGISLQGSRACSQPSTRASYVYHLSQDFHKKERTIESMKRQHFKLGAPLGAKLPRPRSHIMIRCNKRKCCKNKHAFHPLLSFLVL